MWQRLLRQTNGPVSTQSTAVAVFAILVGFSAQGAGSTSDAKGGSGINLHGVTVSGGAGADSVGGSLLNIGQAATGRASSVTHGMRAGAIPVIVVLSAPRFHGDYDGDGDIDLDDFQEFAGSCLELGGPGVDALPACDFGDFDSDRHVDLQDSAGFQRAFGAMR